MRLNIKVLFQIYVLFLSIFIYFSCRPLCECVNQEIIYIDFRRENISNLLVYKTDKINLKIIDSVKIPVDDNKIMKFDLINLKNQSKSIKDFSYIFYDKESDIKDTLKNIQYKKSQFFCPEVNKVRCEQVIISDFNFIFNNKQYKNYQFSTTVISTKN